MPFVDIRNLFPSNPNVCYWHLADILSAELDVCCWPKADLTTSNQGNVALSRR